ncbi:transcriptional regulation of mitochondrial recombination-domain-containing protein [Sphaerosporella brunnea]|uniref:Large ribosomal subunit protein mL67 n=1 Tax=Sphaerosporella brunnea TaxID=1250544 RepID=A0A5J5F4J3_9PEZI|nr:transcriptional regulation of mitochondrial recombination-domain-containing protein [Sphaerosporella brunnea]
MPPKPSPKVKFVKVMKNAAQHGRNIFIYNNIQTNQVVYSLTRALNNNEALKQLPFIAKKTKPAALRKDHWAPLATVSFPNSDMGLKTYHMLREFRKLHETKYDQAGTFNMEKKKLKYVLMNQKANSIADLAESLRIEIERADAAGSPIAEGDVSIRWRNTRDAEHAQQWPGIVVHGDQGRADRPYVAPKPEETSPIAEAVVEAEAPKEEAQVVAARA